VRDLLRGGRPRHITGRPAHGFEYFRGWLLTQARPVAGDEFDHEKALRRFFPCLSALYLSRTGERSLTGSRQAITSR
jgi:hypothetical protein